MRNVIYNFLWRSDPCAHPVYKINEEYTANIDPVIQNIQPNTTTARPTATTHIQITVQPVLVTSASSKVPVEVTSVQTQEPYTHHALTESSTLASPSHPVPSPLPSTVQAYSQHPPSISSVDAPIKVVSPSAEPYHAPSESPKPSSSRAAVAHEKPKPYPKPAHTSPTLGSSGSQWCMTYSPYTASGDCKTASAVSSDIAAIASKGFSSIRLYSTDCSGLAHVGSAASSHGLKIILGIFISETGISAAEEQIDEIIQWSKEGEGFTGVEMIVVGNEAVFNGYASASDLAAFITKCKAAFAAAGYTGPITTTEPINVLQEHGSTLCPVLDAAAANIHPFFNADVAAANAGAFVAQELALLEKICPGLEAYNLETGWPSAGQTNGEACPGEEEQRVAIASIKEHVGGKSAFFSFENDLWKSEGEFAVEQSWGCSQLFGD